MSCLAVKRFLFVLTYSRFGDRPKHRAKVAHIPSHPQQTTMTADNAMATPRRFRSLWAVAVLAFAVLADTVKAAPLDDYKSVGGNNIRRPFPAKAGGNYQNGGDNNNGIAAGLVEYGNGRDRDWVHSLRSSGLRRFWWRPVECQLFAMDVVAESAEEQLQLDLADEEQRDALTSYVCQIPDSPVDPFTVYTLTFHSQDVVHAKAQLSPSDIASVYSGRAWLNLTRASILGTRIIINEESDVTITEEDAAASAAFAGRGLGMRRGTATTLVVRVIDVGGRQAQQKAVRLSDDFFGTKGDQVHLASQMSACSGGLLRYVPAVGEGIVGGVVEVTLDTNVSMYGPYYNPAPSLAELESHVMFAVNTKLGYNPESVCT